MRCALISDIHSNFHALQSVLADAESQGVERIACLGDIVGYAANPRECLQAVREHADLVVAGNHDFGAVGKIELAYFNADARDTIEWTQNQLSREERRYLAELPLTAQLDGVLLVHATPYFPEYFGYIQTLYDAALGFSKLQHKVAALGHSHVPVVFVDSMPIDYFLLAEFEIPEQWKLMVNVGSVGQPRDLDPRASYAVLDTEARRIFMRRVDYDIGAAAEAILRAGLPITNAQRLFLGR